MVNKMIRVKEAYNPFNLRDGTKSKTTIAISKRGSNHAIIPAYGFNNGDAASTFLNTS